MIVKLSLHLTLSLNYSLFLKTFCSTFLYSRELRVSAPQGFCVSLPLSSIRHVQTCHFCCISLRISLFISPHQPTNNSPRKPITVPSLLRAVAPTTNISLKGKTSRAGAFRLRHAAILMLGVAFTESDAFVLISGFYYDLYC